MRFLTDAGPTNVVVGAGCIADLPERLGLATGARVVVVTDAGLMAAGHPARLLGILTSAGFDVDVFDRVRENPDTEDIIACLGTLRRGPVGAVVALGGGSSIDTAKGAALLFANGGTLGDFWHTGAIGNDLPALVAIPTTAGTGSEMQSYAIVSDPVTHRKMAIGTPKLAPSLAFLDPDLTESMPLRTAAMTGIDAMSHALEAAVSTKTTPVGRVYALEAWELIRPHLPAVLAGSADAAARLAMLTGSASAGRAIENGMLGAAHALANPLTARYGVPHGQAVGIMLPYVVRHNGADGAISRLYDELGGSGAVADFAEAMLESAGLPGQLRDLGVGEGDLDQLSGLAAEQWTAGFNPRPVGRADLLSLYRAAY